MVRLISYRERIAFWLVTTYRAACVVGLVALPATIASAVGLRYVDGDNGANGASNLSPLANISLIDDPPATNDGLWSFRSDGGAANPGDIFKTVYEASGGNNPEDVPEIMQTVSGLAASTAYDVYVVYWQGAQGGHNWTVRAGFASGNLTLFNANGPNATFPDAIAGVPALHHDWELSAIPTDPTDGQPLFFEAGRTLLLGDIGTMTSSVSGQISVFIDDLPTTGGTDAGSSGARTWFEGVAYVPAGTAVHRAPGDFNGVNGVDDADALEFLGNMHTDISSLNVLQAYAAGDLNADFAINHTDFVMFKDLYEADNGSGSFAGFIAGVPEPSASTLLAIGCIFAASILFCSRRQRLQFAFKRAHTMSSAVRVLSACLFVSLLAGATIAAPVTNWFTIVPGDGTPSPKPAFDLNTASPILGDGAQASAAQVALWADISGSLNADPDISLANGQRVTLSGSVSLFGIVSSQEQFRWGLFNDNSSSPFDAFGWGGYMASQSASTNGGNLRAKHYDSATTFAQTGTAVNLQLAQDGDPFTDGTYNFAMKISRFDDELSIDASLTNGAGFLQEWKSAIAAAPNAVITDFNRVGFLSGNPMSADRIEFHDIDVSVDAAEALTVEVVTDGPQAGTVKLRNKSAVSFDIDYYEITSVDGSLNVGGWTSLDQQESDPPLQGWDEVPASNSHLLSEIMLEPDSFTTVGPGTSLNLGSAFTVGATEDLRFSFGLADGTFARGIVQYVDDVSLTGDYNGDGAVDAADYVVWRKTNINGAQGYLDWRNNFGAVAGAGAWAGDAASVPEPAISVLLCVSVPLLLGFVRGRRRS